MMQLLTRDIISAIRRRLPENNEHGITVELSASGQYVYIKHDTTYLAYVNFMGQVKPVDGGKITDVRDAAYREMGLDPRTARGDALPVPWSRYEWPADAYGFIDLRKEACNE